MKRPSLKEQFEDDESSVDDQITEAIVDAFAANDKVIEIRPAKRSKRMGLKNLLLVGAAAIGFTYWARNSQKSDDVVQGVKDMTANRIHQAAEAIEEGSEAASERLEEGSERATEAVQEAGEKVSEQAEEAGKKASQKAEEAGEKASKKAEEAGEKASDKAEEAGEKASDKTEKTGKKAADKTEETGKKASDKTEESGEKVVQKMVKGDGKASDGTDRDSGSSGS